MSRLRRRVFECYDYSAVVPSGRRDLLPAGAAVRFARTFAVVLFASSFSAAAADSGKVLRTAFSIAESSFDPVLAYDAASNSVVEEISESMLDYDAPIAGLEIIDRYTLRIRLKQPDYTFLYVLAMPASAAVAREVIDAYGNDAGAHPVGTGPYLLKEYKRSSRIVLEANPQFRKFVFDEPAPANKSDAATARALKG